MRDNAVVLSVEDSLAWVKVSPRVSCGECSARSFCAGQKDAAGRLAVRNPLQARPGDTVVIEVPETNYHQDLIRIFGCLLVGLLLGLALGYVIRPLGGLGQAENGLFGLVAGLGLSGFGLFYYYRSQKRQPSYPMIVEISDKGGSHGQA
jgi:positive regulator of sigma E activity